MKKVARPDRWAFFSRKFVTLIATEHGTQNHSTQYVCKTFRFDVQSKASDRLWSSAWLDTQNMKKARSNCGRKATKCSKVCYVILIFFARKWVIQYGQLLCNSESVKCVRASMMWYHIPLLVIRLSSCCHLWNGTRDYPYTQSSLKLNTPFSWNDTRDSISLVRMLCW